MDTKSIKHLILLEIFSPEDPVNDLSTEEQRNQMYNLYKQGKSWEEVFKPIDHIDQRIRLIELLCYLDSRVDKQR